VPAIVATEMLESMRERETPTRAEASDVAHAVWDGADAVMLSAESAVGRHPVEAVAMMDRIVREAESVDAGGMPRAAGSAPGRPDHAIGSAVAEILARDRAVRGVVAFTVSGFSARLIAAAHPRQPVLALTPEPRVRERLALVRGVTAVRCARPHDEAEMLAAVDREARAAFDARPGDTVVLVGAMPIGSGRGTNFLALHQIR
jgi:pyruvate kinase